MRKGFTIHHNGPPANCVGRPHSRCVAFWAAVRAFHTNPEPIGKDWSDIAYSFGVCPHGERLVGRGWDKDQFANGTDQVGADDGPNRDWYSVLVFVGGGPGTGDPEEQPTREMVVATAALIEEGRGSGRCGSAVRPHSDWKPKPCPGPTFTALSRQWDGQPITIDPPQEDDVTEAELKKALDDGLTYAIRTPGHPFRAEFARLVDSRLVALKVATTTDLAGALGDVQVEFDPEDVAALADAIPDEIAKDVADLLHARLAG